MKSKYGFFLIVFLLNILSVFSQEILPFPPAPSASEAGRTINESVYKNREVKSHLSKDAPNILIVLIDNAGPGLPDTYGGEVHIKTLNELGGLDVLGSPKTGNMYHAGWAWAGSTPYKGTKLLGAYFGGTRQPLAVSWPKKIKIDKTPHSQFHHVNDIVPTIYEAAGIKKPEIVNGFAQDPFDGISMLYSFNDAKAPDQKHTQFFDIMGSRSIYHDGWIASAFGPRIPWTTITPGIDKWTPDKDT